MKHNFSIKIDEHEIPVSLDELAKADIISTSEGVYHVIDNKDSLQVEIIELNGKELTLRIDGEVYTATIQDEYDMLVNKMGLSVVTSSKMTSVKAPMPGLVLEVMVEPGQEVDEGDDLLILEAMKMENVLKATGKGVVKSIEIAKGDAVDKGKILIEME